MNLFKLRQSGTARLAASAILLALIAAPPSAIAKKREKPEEKPKIVDLESVPVVGVRGPSRTGFGGFGGFGTGGGGGGAIRITTPTVVIDNRDAEKKDCGKGNPILPSTGNKIEPEMDFSANGEMGLYLSRTYNHYWKGAGLFGKHWISSFDYKLSFGSTALGGCYPRPGGGACGIGANTIIYAWRPDGRTIKYVRNAADGIFYEEKPSPVSKIVKQPDGSFVLHGENNEAELYSSAGYVSAISNDQNVGWTFTYINGTYPHRVTHTSGRYVEFTWTSGQLTAVRDPAGTYYGYSYNVNQFGTGLHRLTASSQMSTPATTTTYHYEMSSDPTALTGKSLNGVRYSRFTYDANGYATSSEHNGWEKHTFAYTPGSNGLLTTVHTNPLGKTTTYVFKNGKPTTITGHPSTYCPYTSYALTEYDSNGYPAMRSDFNNNNTAFIYNAKGQLTQQTEAYGTQLARTTQYEWHPTANRILSVTVLGDSKTTYDYGSNNRVYRIAVTNLSGNGVANQTRETFYSYTSYSGSTNGVAGGGMLASITVDGPLAADTQVLNYDPMGNLISVSNSLGHQIVYSGHNGRGQPGRLTGVNGEVTDYTYDARGRVTQMRNYPAGAAADTTHAYNAAGLLSRTTTPDGQSQDFAYDNSQRLVSRTQSEGGGLNAEARYSYNLASDVTSTVISRVSADTGGDPGFPGDPGGPGGGNCNPICVIPQSQPGGIQSFSNVQSSSMSGGTGTAFQSFTDYDELSRSRARRGNNGQNVRYTYDLNGNVKTVTDSMNRTTTLYYDALDRLVASVDPLNQTTSFEYDAGDRLTKVTDPRGNITTYVYDGFGQLWAQYSPDTGATTYEYNAAGQLTRTTRNDGSWLSYQYDGLGRLTWTGNSVQGRAFGYDWCTNGKGRLCSADSNVGTKHYAYTPEGLVSITRDWTPSSDEWTGYSYDNMGRLVGMSYPSGVSVGYGYSGGKLSVMQATINGITQNVATGMQYQPFGPMTSMTYGNGVIKERSFDLDGRLTVTHDHGLVGHTQQYNQNDEITSIENWSRPTYNQQFNYDALSRLIGISSPSGNQSLYYDPNGNRTRHIWGPDMLYNIDPNSNRVLNEHLSYSYDGRGNRASQSWGGSTATYSYDAFNRLGSVSRNVANTYSSPGNWTNRAYPAGTTTYTINGLGQRTGKSGPMGTSRFVYAGQNTMLTEHTNGVWTSYLYLSGEPIALVRNNQLFFLHNDHLARPEVVSDTSATTRWVAANYAFDRAVLWDTIGGLNLGLPGQYFDAETGFWYNGFRDYDSRVGQYIQSDPIGLAGGLNTYAYVYGNPISLVDPLGLDALVCTYPGSGPNVWGHIGIGVGQNPTSTTGYYPERATLRALRGTPGAVRQDSGEAKECKTIKTTEEQDKVMQSAIDARQKNPGTYSFTGNNCVSFVRSVLQSIGVQTPGSIKPYEYLDGLEGNGP